MSDDGIFMLRDGDVALTPMVGTGFDSEDVLQDLVGRYPDLLAGGQMTPGSPRRWLLLCREMGVPKQDGGGDHWSVDHLLVDQDAVPTIVEVKRSTDPRIRREVVGQMLDYAANGPRYWTAADLRTRLERTLGPDSAGAEDVLRELTQDPDDDIESFLARVEVNLRSGRVRLVFLADVVPVELRSIVEFLNQQMSPAEVFAVEVRQYVGEGVRTLIPRVVGATAEARQRKQPAASLPFEELLAGASSVARSVDDRFLELGRRLGLAVHQTKTAHQLRTGARSVVQFYPAWGNNGALEFNLDQLRRAGAGAPADRILGRLQGLCPTRKLTAKYPWVDGAALDGAGWTTVAAIVEEDLLPALREAFPA